MNNPKVATEMTTCVGVVTALPQAEAHQQDASRERRAKGVAYRHRWAIWAMALLAAAGNAQAATLSAVVQAGRQGVVGFTDYVSSSVSGPLRDGTPNPEYGFPAVSMSEVECSNLSDPDLKKGTSGVYGFSLIGPVEGAVLLVDGTGTWTRRLANAEVINGSVVFTAGRWTNTWTGSRSSGDSAQSNADGTSYKSYVACPNTFINGSSFQWSKLASRSSALNVRFLIDAPEGGLLPGKYSLTPLYHGDFSTVMQGDLSSILVDGVDVTVMNYGCTLSAPASIAMDSLNPDARILVGARCEDGAVKSQNTITAWLSIERSGVSRPFTLHPRALQMSDGNDDFYITGNWYGSQAECIDDTESDMYFDGRPGIALGKVSPGQSVNFGVIPLAFRLCEFDNSVPGEYTAQATLSLIQR